MTKPSVAQPAPRTSRNTREDRARVLAAEHHHEIAASQVGFEYLVPSCTGEHAYRVHYDPCGDAWCECPDHEIRRAVCKHILACAIVVAELRRKGGRFIRSGEIAEIAELTGIALWELSDSFSGERKNICLEVVKAAVEADPEGGPEAWGESIRFWAKSAGRGMYHPAILDAPPLEFGGRAGFELNGV